MLDNQASVDTGWGFHAKLDEIKAFDEEIYRESIVRANFSARVGKELKRVNVESVWVASALLDYWKLLIDGRLLKSDLDSFQRELIKKQKKSAMKILRRDKRIPKRSLRILNGEDVPETDVVFVCYEWFRLEKSGIRGEEALSVMRIAGFREEVLDALESVARSDDYNASITSENS